MHSATINDQAYELLSWQDFGEQIKALSQKIVASDETFDRMIALAKGGTTISRSLLDQCGIKELSSIQIEFYTGIASTSRTPVITQSLPVRIKDERILIVDDIADSGESLILANKYIKQHGASDVKTATLVTKSWTKFKPDYSQHQTDAWVIFPWETRETIELLSALWMQKGDSSQSIADNLAMIGFAPDEIELFSGVKNLV